MVSGASFPDSLKEMYSVKRSTAACAASLLAEVLTLAISVSEYASNRVRTAISSGVCATYSQFSSDELLITLVCDLSVFAAVAESLAIAEMFSGAFTGPVFLKTLSGVCAMFAKTLSGILELFPPIFLEVVATF